MEVIYKCRINILSSGSRTSGLGSGLKARLTALKNVGSCDQSRFELNRKHPQLDRVGQDVSCPREGGGMVGRFMFSISVAERPRWSWPDRALPASIASPSTGAASLSYSIDVLKFRLAISYA